MNAVATPTRPKTATKRAKPEVSSEELEFIQGRDWAIRCLEDAQAFNEAQTKETNCRRWVRKGQPQDNFVLGWIADTVGGPPALKNHALRGFCAVLSDYLSNPAGTMYPHAYRLPYAEYHKGEVGANGTRSAPPEIFEDDAAAQVETGSAPEPATAPQPSAKWAFDALARAEMKIKQAYSVLLGYADGHGSSELWGVLALVETLGPSIAEYSKAEDVGDPAFGALQNLNGDISNVAAIVRIVAVEIDDIILHAIMSLLEAATSRLEADCMAEVAKRQAEAPNA